MKNIIKLKRQSRLGETFVIHLTFLKLKSRIQKEQLLNEKERAGGVTQVA
jgi:hypothetical protein